MPKYKIIAHRRVHKFLSSLKDENLKRTITDCIAKLDGYPALISVDDIYRVFHLPLSPPAAYWEVISWVYPLCSFTALFLFGRANQPKKSD